MAVPDFQSFFRPMLEALADGTPKSLSALREHLRTAMAVSDADFQEMLPSGVRTRFADRVYWANTHLYQAGLIERPSSGVLLITERGRTFLSVHRGKILVSDLMQFPEFVAFRNRTSTQPPGAKPSPPSDRSPQERIEEAFRELEATTAKELLDRVSSSSPAAFERLVIQLLLKMGYGGGERDASEHLGVESSSAVEWHADGDRVVVRRVVRYSSEDIHRALFAKPPQRRTLRDLKAGVRQAVAKP